MQAVNFVETPEHVEEFWRWLSVQPVVAVDTETSDFKTANDLFYPSFRIRLIQFGTTEEAWVLDFQRWRGLVESIFKRFTGIWLMHNSSFDVKVLGREGIVVPWRQVHDTMIMMRLAEPTERAGLKEAAGRHVSRASSQAKKDLDTAFRRQGWTWDTVPLDFPPYRFYAALDPILTARLFETPIAKLGRNSPVYNLEMQVRAVCTRMEQNGLRINVQFCRDRAVALRARAETTKGSVSDKYGVLVTSPSQLSTFFMGQAEARPYLTKTTQGGKVSVDKEVLDALCSVPGSTGEVAWATLAVRRDEKIAGSYLENFVDMKDGDDLVHASIETLAARTGRMSVRDPGLQTLPKPALESEYRVVREAVVSRPDHALVSCDFDQIELRIAASLSRDEGLIEAFKVADSGDTDFFTALARGVYHDPDLVKKDPRRDRIKTLCYASLYGASVRRMAIAAGVSLDEMHDVHDGMRRQYPGFFAIMHDIERESVMNGGYIDTVYGRRLPISDDRSYAATNFKIQGSAADVLKRSLVTLGQAGLEDMMLLPVHDEVLFDVPLNDVEEVRHLVRQSMRCVDFDVPLTANPSDGCENWALAK